MQVAEFPSFYPCSKSHFCASGCCQSAMPFFDGEPEIEDDLPLVWEHQRLESTALSVMHKKQNLPNAPTKLARGKYTWDDDFSGRNEKKVVTLHNAYDHYRECNEHAMLTPYVAPQIYQKSGIPPPENISSTPSVGYDKSDRKDIVRKIIKSPRGRKETKLVEL